jgi:hypothetical protein
MPSCWKHVAQVAQVLEARLFEEVCLAAREQVVNITAASRRANGQQHSAADG